MSNTLPYPHAKQREFMVSPARYKALVWGRRSGKSLGIALYTMLKALEKPGNYYIVAPTYTQAKSIYWADILKILIPEAIIKKTDESELYVEFQQVHYKLQTEPILGYNIDSDHSTAPLPSRIYLKGANNPDSLRGVKLSGAVLDEFAFFQYDMDTLNKIIMPTLADLQGWLIISSTPDGFNNEFARQVTLFKDSIRDGDESYFYSHATMLDNTSIVHRAEEFENMRIRYERDGRLDEWTQEWLAQFTSPSSMVYPRFSIDTHVINPQLIPRENMTYAIGIDFGLKDPFAAVFVAIDQDDNWYIYDEIYAPDMDIFQIARAMHNKMGDQYFTRIVGDSAAATEIKTLRSKELGELRVYATASVKGRDSLKAGIRLVSTKLAVREGSGKPKLFVGANCKAVIREFQEYKRIRDAWGEVSETPEDKNNHAMDALRYIVSDQTSGAKPIPKATKHYNASGRLVS